MDHDALRELMQDDSVPHADATAESAPLLERLAALVRTMGGMLEQLRAEDPEAVEAVEDWLAEVNPAAWVRDEATWQRAKEAVDPEGEGAGYVAPWAVVAAVYKRMGGRIG